MIKTFRGRLDDEEQEKIRLSTKKGKIGYKIVKFQMIGAEPGAKLTESTMKIFKVEQSTVNSIIDFSDGNLLAAGYWAGKDTSGNTDTIGPIIFEQEVFNQDIFITHHDAATGEACNYYLELETSPLTDNAAVVSTLRDIRLNPAPE